VATGRQDRRPALKRHQYPVCRHSGNCDYRRPSNCSHRGLEFCQGNYLLHSFHKTKHRGGNLRTAYGRKYRSSQSTGRSLDTLTSHNRNEHCSGKRNTPLAHKGSKNA
jgi:hypothetical protein